MFAGLFRFYVNPDPTVYFDADPDPAVKPGQVNDGQM